MIGSILDMERRPVPGAHGAASGPGAVAPHGREAALGPAQGRSFLFLQGPHGPFMAELSAALRQIGARTARIAFNAGDELGWRDGALGDPGPLLRFDGRFEDFEAALRGWIGARAATDLVLYGDTRPFHACARQVGKTAGVTVHCLEEGYLRPRWITYERGGVNGNSPLLGISLEDMAAASRDAAGLEEAGREGWGAARAHAMLGVRYHARVRLRRGAWPDTAPHMPAAGWKEARAYLRRGAALPLLSLRSRRSLAQLTAPGAPRFHLALLQLGADSSLRAHSRFSDVATAVEEIIDAYAEAARRAPVAPLVFKAHPFEDGRERLDRVAARAARRAAVSGQVHFIDRAPLAPLLDRALAVATVNSTGAQGALRRGLPVLALGESIYSRAGLVSGQRPAEFFADPAPPDPEACRALRRFLLLSSQIEGDFYTAAGRAVARPAVIEAMLRPCDPYEIALGRPA